jgi:hypothetical protein
MAIIIMISDLAFRSRCISSIWTAIIIYLSNSYASLYPEEAPRASTPALWSELLDFSFSSLNACFNSINLALESYYSFLSLVLSDR